MELAQHLVRPRPRALRGRQLVAARARSTRATCRARWPTSLADAAARAVAPTRASCATLLALADGDALALADYAALTAHGDPRRVFRALDELVAARVLVGRRRALPLRAARLRAACCSRSMPAARRARCTRASPTCSRRPAATCCAARTTCSTAGATREAIELLCERRPAARAAAARAARARARRAPSGWRAAGAHAARAAHGAADQGAVRAGARELPALAAAACSRSSSATAASPRTASSRTCPQASGCRRRSRDTQERYLAHARARARATAWSTRSASSRQLSAAFCSLADAVLDLELLESLPSLEPLLPLSPCAARDVAQLVEACKDAAIARPSRCVADIYEQMLARIAAAGPRRPRRGAAPTASGSACTTRSAVRGVDRAEPSAEQRAQVLETDRELRVNAWRVRPLLHARPGQRRRGAQVRAPRRAAAAAGGQRAALPRHQRRLRAARVRAGRRSARRQDARSRTSSELARALSGLAPGAAARRSATTAGCRATCTARSTRCSRALRSRSPARHAYFSHLAAAHRRCSASSGGSTRRSRSRKQLRRDLRARAASTATTGLRGARAGARRAPASSSARSDRWTRCCGRRASCGRSGWRSALLYEARARIAIWMHDPAAFERYAELCCAEYGKGRTRRSAPSSRA